MGEHSHFSMDFDHIISVTLNNYVDLQINSKNGNEDGLYFKSQDPWVQEVLKAEEHGSCIPHYNKKVSSVLDIMTNPHLDSSMDTSKSPAYWSRVCLLNMARLAKEATTIRRVLEPLFQIFDADNLWSPEKGVVCSVLTYFQSLLEESGDNSHLLLSTLVKHLDHKNVVKKPLIQIDIVIVTTQLAKTAKQQASVAIIGAISDLIKHLRRCLQNLAEVSSPGDVTDKWNIDLQSAIEKCIAQLSIKVGDMGPILDMIALVLENIPATTLVARTTISAVLQTAKIISSIPTVSYYMAFPEALFHQLLLAMSHPDPETRVGAHNIFSMVLMPSLLCPWVEQYLEPSQAISRLSSVGMMQKVRNRSVSIQDERKDTTEPSGIVLYKQSYSFNHALTDGKMEPTCLRLSSHQISLLLSSIWVQASSTDNTPANFVAMAHAYNIALLCSQSKTSNNAALVKCFQLALSLRSISLDKEGGLQPSRRRSLFTLASSMLIFSARAGGFLELIPVVKASLTDKTVDPYLQLVDDIRLQVVSIEPDKMLYGSQEDESAALESLSALDLDDQRLKETIISHFVSKSGKLSEDDLFGIRKQLSEGFSPDDAYPLGPPLFLETPRPCSPLAQMEFLEFDEVTAASTDEETFPEPSGSQSGRRTSLSINNLDIISVNQLLESVLETARQVASIPVSSTPIPYDQMKSQCEALVLGKQQKMSALHSSKHQKESTAIVPCDEIENNCHDVPTKSVEFSNADLQLITTEPIQGHDQHLGCSVEYRHNSFRLPPSSPYDKFLKAAGC